MADNIGKSAESIIKAAVERGASDIHIKAGDAFRARIDGQLQPLTKQRLTPDQTKAIALRLIPLEEDRKRIDSIRDYDCSWGAAGVGRFRVNILRQRSSFMIVMRVIPFEVPSFEKLHLPKVLERVASEEHGLILVAGPRGGGKSSTTAAIINDINQRRRVHIVTLESPIEFLFRDLNSSITQREVGSDTESFVAGLGAALRQDPDVISIGDLRDAATADAALAAAEVGHLVISTLHATNAATTVSRAVALFSPDEQEPARLRLAETLRAVVAQRLIPRADGQGRCAVVEVMISTPEIRRHIRERRGPELREAVARGRELYGMQTFEQHLEDMVESGVVSPDVAQGMRGEMGGGNGGHG